MRGGPRGGSTPPTLVSGFPDSPAASTRHDSKTPLNRPRFCRLTPHMGLPAELPEVPLVYLWQIWTFLCGVCAIVNAWIFYAKDRPELILKLASMPGCASGCSICSIFLQCSYSLIFAGFFEVSFAVFFLQHFPYKTAHVQSFAVFSVKPKKFR